MIPEENWPAPPETPVEGAAAAALTPADVFTGENDANDDESDARSEKPEEPEDSAEATPMDTGKCEWNTEDKSTDGEAGDVLETPPKFPTLPESWEGKTSGTKRPASEASTVLGEDEDSGEPLQKKSTGMGASAAAKPAAVAKPAAAAKRAAAAKPAAAAAKSKGRGSGAAVSSSGGAPARGGGRGGKATAPGGEAMRAALAAGSRSRRAKAA